VQQVYSLEQVLDYKKRLEDREKENLAQVELVKQQQKERLNALLAVLEEQLDKAVSVYSIEQRGQYWNAQLERIEQARRSLESAQVECDHRQACLLKAAVERKKFELHRDAELAEKRHLYLQAEQKMLDECALQAYLRQKERK
jgi:flagellar export protein FliJ